MVVWWSPARGHMSNIFLFVILLLCITKKKKNCKASKTFTVSSPTSPHLHVWAPRLLVPTQAAAWQAANLVWQVARQCHRLTAENSACLHSFPPFCSPDLNPTASYLSLPHPPSCWANIMPEMEACFLQTSFFTLMLFCLLFGFVLMYVFVLKVTQKNWIMD